MSAVNPLPLMLVGLLGSVHCIGMCGGVVSALSFTGARARTVIPIVDATATATASAAAAALAPSIPSAWVRTLMYNLGRLASYGVAGAVAGGVLGGVRTLAGFTQWQLGGYVLAQIMLVLLGLYLVDIKWGLSWLERAGQHLWKALQPALRHVLPVDTPFKALAMGAVWGWVPCGMVYSMLMNASFSGSAALGALTMLSFGAGTLPMMLGLGVAGARFGQWMRQPGVRMAGGLIVMAFGVLGLVRVMLGLPMGLFDALCIGSPA